MAIVTDIRLEVVDPKNGQKFRIGWRYDDANPQAPAMLALGGQNNTTQPGTISVTYNGVARTITLDPGDQRVRDVSDLGIVGTIQTNKFGSVLVWPVEMHGSWPA